MNGSWSSAALSDTGKIRTSNEDSYALLGEDGVYIVADGMGGHAAGDVASRIAVDVLTEALTGPDGPGADGEPAVWGRRLTETLESAHRRILEEAESPEKEGMGTTATALVVRRPTLDYIIGHVGDSRIYRLRSGSLELLTRDQTWVQQWVDAGRLTAEEARVHPYSSVLVQALGVEGELEPQVLTGSVEPGDLYLLCSDGLNAALSDEEIEEVLKSEGEPPVQELARLLVDAANEHGGPDNITVILVAAPAS